MVGSGRRSGAGRLRSCLRLRDDVSASGQLLGLAVLAGPGLAGCDSLYYKTMKRFGVEKRDILVKRVREARESQQKGKEEFRSALDRFKEVRRPPPRVWLPNLCPEIFLESSQTTHDAPDPSAPVGEN